MPYIKIPLKNVINIEKIITIFELSVRPDFEYPGEEHDFCELNYVAEGDVFLNFNGKKTHMKEGELCVHSSGQFHDMYGNGDTSAKVVVISFECHSSVINFFEGRVVSVPKELRPKFSEMLRLARDCFRHSSELRGLVVKKNAPFGSEQLLQGELESFFIRLIQSEEQNTRSFFSTRDEMLDKLTSDIKDYLKNNLYTRLDLDDLCKQFHFGKSHICHVFKSKTGVGIIQYYIKLKISEAEKLLCQTERTVIDISNALGFESPQYFSRLFKRETGHTPTSFRERSAIKTSTPKPNIL